MFKFFFQFFNCFLFNLFIGFSWFILFFIVSLLFAFFHDLFYFSFFHCFFHVSFFFICFSYVFHVFFLCVSCFSFFHLFFHIMFIVFFTFHVFIFVALFFILLSFVHSFWSLVHCFFHFSIMLFFNFSSLILFFFSVFCVHYVSMFFTFIYSPFDVSGSLLPPPWADPMYYEILGVDGDIRGYICGIVVAPNNSSNSWCFFRTWQADLGSPGGLNVQFSWAQCHCWVEWGIFGKDWWEPPRKKTKIWSIFWEIIPSGQKRGQRQATNCRPSAGTVASTIAQRLPESCCPQTSWPHSAGRPICRPHGVWGPRSFLPWIAEEAI
jgi:hypothetical protein